MKFLKNFNLPLVAAVFLVTIAAAIIFMMSREKSDDTALAAAKRLENKRLPAGISGQINEESFLLVYLTSGCGGCSDELGFLSELSASSPGPKIFGIMGEDESVVKNYVKDNNIKFPVIADRNLDMLRGLRLEFFPANLTIEKGVIKRAYLGVPESKEHLSTLIPD